MDLREIGLDLSGSGQRLVVGSCENCNELLFSVKYSEILE
jgi:hypothetical protein